MDRNTEIWEKVIIIPPSFALSSNTVYEIALCPLKAKNKKGGIIKLYISAKSKNG